MQNVATQSVPLPPGANGASTWEDWDDQFRIIYSENRPIEGTNSYVWASAIQFPDGRVDVGAEEPPYVNVELAGNLTTAQARELAAQILAAADLIDGWVAR